MPPKPNSLDAYIEANAPRFLSELKELLRIPSISTLPHHRPDMDRALVFLADRMHELGLEHIERIVPDERPNGQPLLYADWLHAPGAPTVLFYGHYDVQPPDPVEEWKSPPFEPTIRNGNIYARGSADDKGQMYTHLKAVEAWVRTRGKLPINVRFLIEGEEEVGGETVEWFIKHSPKRLACDCAVVSDTAMFAPGLPSLTVGLRGMVYAEVDMFGPAHDLHSGMYGGVAPNPFEGLARVIAGLKSPDGKVLIPGFYDGVASPREEEKASWRRMPFDEEAYRRDEVGSEALTGEAGYSVLERTWTRPTLDVHGMPGGFTGPGSKTVIPARASAKISMRLVPNQNPEAVYKCFVAEVKRLTPRGLRSDVRLHSVGGPVVVDTGNRFIRAGADALSRVFGAPPVYARSGGSVPVVALFTSVLKAPTVMMGFGLPDDGLHAPNEKFKLDNYYGGIRAVADFIGAVAHGASPHAKG